MLINDLSFDVPPGAVIGICGGNGAGKSTLFKMILGHEQPDGGDVVLGETVKPMYVEQSRSSLDGNRCDTMNPAHEVACAVVLCEPDYESDHGNGA